LYAEADPARIGVTGHSFGGEGAPYVGTMSKMFAAVGMGAGVVDLASDFAMNRGRRCRPGGSALWRLERKRRRRQPPGL
jgi:dipeptidyl aminopeptidase/acylaminoacyl peptidase